MFKCLNKKSDCRGWADRVKGIMFAYAVSLITNRQLVIKILHPCSLTNFIQPNEVNWDIEIPSNLTTHTMKLNNLYVKTELPTLNFLEYKKDVDVIEMNPKHDHIKLLASNPKHHQRIKEMGFKIKEFDSLNLFHRWYNRLFKFTSSMEKEYQDLLRQLKPYSNSTLICAQLRIGGKRKETQFNDYFFMNPDKKVDYWSFIRKRFLPNILKNDQAYKIFVTSDTLGVVEDAIKEFGDKNVIGSKDLGVNIDKYENLANDKCHIKYSYIDFSLLGKCDMGVLSYSGFGRYGILNRPNKNFQNFYVYYNKKITEGQMWNRHSLQMTFHKYWMHN